MTSAVFLAAILLSATDAPADATAADLAKMQGEWMVATMKADGMEIPADDAQALFRSVEGDKFSVSRYTKVVSRGTFTIDPTKTPKTIDSAMAAAGGAPGKPILGIYEFDGEKVRICNARPGQPRPKNFEAK